MLVLILLFLSLQPFQPHEPIHIEKALNDQLVDCTITGTFDSLRYSSHYGKCIALEVRAGETPVNVGYEAGQLLAPNVESTQQIILTESGTIALGPYEFKRITLFGMCSEMHDSGPSNSDTFQFNGLASTDMTGLADLIYQKQYQNNTGQAAMWSLSDNEPVAYITGEDEKMVMELRKYVASVKGEQVPAFQPRLINAQHEMKKLEVVFEARVKKAGMATITLYNPDGSLNKHLIKDQYFPVGWHRIKFFAESINMAKGSYKVVLEIEGVKRQEEFYFVE